MAEGEQRRLAEEFVEVARQLITAAEVEQVLQRIVALAVVTIEGCDHAGLSLVVDDRIETAAQNDETTRFIARVQADTDQAPGLEAVRDKQMVESGDLAAEVRWPRFAPVVAERTGVRSVLAVPLSTDDVTVGAIDLYAEAVDAFSDDDRGGAAIFAAYAAIAVQAAQERQRLITAIEHRDVIGQAKGILMARQQIDEPSAFALLRNASSRMNQTVREVARRVIEREEER